MNENLNISGTFLSAMKMDDYVRVLPPDYSLLEEIEEKIAISYAMLMLKLQEMCGLTYREARAHLLHYWENEEDFAEDMNISIASVRKLQNRAAWKVRSSGFDIHQLAGKYNHVFYVRTIEPREISSDNDTKVHLQKAKNPSGVKAEDRS